MAAVKISIVDQMVVSTLSPRKDQHCEYLGLQVVFDVQVKSVKSP